MDAFLGRREVGHIRGVKACRDRVGEDREVDLPPRRRRLGRVLEGAAQKKAELC